MQLDFLMYAAALVGVVLALKKEAPDWQRWASIGTLCSAYALYYILASDQVAQDRSSYYTLFLHDNLSRVLKYFFSFAWNKEDILLSLFFVLLPKGLSANSFGILFLLFGLGLYLMFLLFAVRKEVLVFSSVPLVLLVVLFDRLFADLMLNTTASTISATFFAYGLFAAWSPLSVLAYFFSYGFHTRMFYLLLAILPVTAIVHRRRRILWVSFGVATLVFLLKLSGFVLISQDVFADTVRHVQGLFPASTNPSTPGAYARWLLRGLVSGHPLSVSMFVQVALSLMLPLALLWVGQGYGEMTTGMPKGADGERRSGRLPMVFAYLLVTGIVFLFMFPDVALVKRMIILPLLLLPMLLDQTSLRWLAAIKVISFSVAFLRFGLS